jgi:hypothetical protein
VKRSLEVVGNFLVRVGRRVYDEKFLMSAVLITVLLAILIPLRSNRITNEGVKTTVDQTRQTQLDNADTNRQIKDCVDPKGKCYKDAQARSAAVLKSFQEYVILANACSAVVPRDLTLDEAEGQIRRCIADRTSTRDGGR